MSTVLISVILAALLQASLKTDLPPPPDFKIAVDYAAWLDRQVVRGQSQDDNAMTAYNEIIGRLDAEPSAEFKFNGPRTQQKPVQNIEPWDPAKHPQWEASFQAARNKLELFKRASAKPYAWWGVRYVQDDAARVLFQSIMHELPRLRSLAKCAGENAWRAPGGKLDESAFVAAQRSILGLSRQLDRNPALVSQLVAFAIRNQAYADLLRAAELGVLSDKQRSAVILFLAGRDEPPAPITAPIAAEMAVAFDLIQTIAMKGNGKFGHSEAAGFTLNGDHVTNPTELRDAVKAFYELHMKEAAGPYSPAAIERMEEAEAKYTSTDKLCQLIAPNIWRLWNARTRCEATRRATRLVFEIHVYHDKNKKWPESLNDLPPEVAKSAKLDPFSEQPFIYRLEDGNPLLYSVAQNGKDDGAKHDEKWGDESNGADYIFWPRQ